MPTYVCSVPASSLNNDQRKAIADAISRNHSQVTGAPPFFVQVVFEEKQTNDRFLGGEMTGGHVWVRGDIRAGRTKEHRKTLMRQIMEDVSRITGSQQRLDLGLPVQSRAHRHDRVWECSPGAWSGTRMVRGVTSGTPGLPQESRND